MFIPSYGSRSVNVVENEMRSYKKWYGVNGIFFDEMSSVGSKLKLLPRFSQFCKFAQVYHDDGQSWNDSRFEPRRRLLESVHL